jgi:N-succinyldiaminopimelate aminotransferase
LLRARRVPEAHGFNPGVRRVRIALVADREECAEGIERIVAFARRL